VTLKEKAKAHAERVGNRLIEDSSEPKWGFKDPDGFHPTYWYTTAKLRILLKEEETTKPSNNMKSLHGFYSLD